MRPSPEQGDRLVLVDQWSVSLFASPDLSRSDADRLRRRLHRRLQRTAQRLARRRRLPATVRVEQ